MADPETATKPSSVSRLEKLKALKSKRNEITKANKQTLFQDSRNQKLLSIKARKEEADAKDNDKEEEEDPKTQRERNLEYTLEEYEKWDSKVQQSAKSKKEGGFQNFNHLAHSTYDKSTKDLEVDLEDYKSQKQKEKSGIAGVDFSNKPDPNITQKLAKNIQDTNLERLKRRRGGEDEKDVSSFINEKNRQFNMKLNRQYK